MRTFFFRLCGPMQSWGTQSRFLVRDTGLEPSKSGLVGLICASMGTARDDRDSIAKIAGLRMAVRVDRPGIMRMDYQTTGGARTGNGYGVIRADASGLSTVVSRRYYLADAEFLAGIEGPALVLEEIAAALSEPRWQVFLGRKSFVPSCPPVLPREAPWNSGWTNESIEQAVRYYPWLGLLSAVSPRDNNLRVVIDDPSGTEVRRDYPISFDPRIFSTRRVRSFPVPLAGVQSP
jgi:CRISPR system Cascade subunit CasD